MGLYKLVQTLARGRHEPERSPSIDNFDEPIKSNMIRTLMYLAICTTASGRQISLRVMSPIDIAYTRTPDVLEKLCATGLVEEREGSFNLGRGLGFSWFVINQKGIRYLSGLNDLEERYTAFATQVSDNLFNELCDSVPENIDLMGRYGRDKGHVYEAFRQANNQIIEQDLRQRVA